MQSRELVEQVGLRDIIRGGGRRFCFLLGPRALALAFPSLYEGFGLPILEAMALGTPVVTSNYGAMAEVAGDAAELVDPYDVDSIRAGLERVTSDTTRRDELRQRGLGRAAQFTWENCARATLAVYAEAIAASKLGG